MSPLRIRRPLAVAALAGAAVLGAGAPAAAQVIVSPEECEAGGGTVLPTRVDLGPDHWCSGGIHHGAWVR
ncbi:hypothetical protein ACFPZ0_27180 [Streptomonospora nanhaiensis]|uniref:Uncharacterized protein n=1 Tax=Streptomonospora nanhaiensis TaxID=1323731 RepID=A0A853BVY6_9ACTN|nr:hypothetical protein [Streptomonospora nanhaiensis]MBX9391874.1 hypothetical protein [Streptomonospora nanhaiensis]NYI98362.1 hypothetical protein [Streptomonospora nanhaiensis]